MHTWIKAMVAGICILVVVLTFARGTDYADGSFTIEAVTKQVVPAPFAGFLYEVYVDPGDKVVAGQTVLATLDTTELRKNLSEKLAERNRYIKQADTLKPFVNQLPQRRQYELRAEEVQSQIDLVKYQIDKARIVAPISGTVLKGDLKRDLGKRVEPSDPLFEIAPLDAMRAEIAVLESRIANLYRAQEASDQPLEGELTPVARPGMKLTFVVEKIHPMAEPIKQRNVVRVQVNFIESDVLQKAKDELWLKPGVEGQARIAVGRAHYVWMWTRDLINWMRMKFWW